MSKGIPRLRRIIGNVEVENAGWSEEIQEVLHRITAGIVRQFIHKRLDGKRMVDARHRPQPAEADVGLRGTVLDANIGDVKRHLDPIPLKLPAAMTCCGVKGGVDWRKSGALQPGGRFTLESSAPSDT